MKSEFDLIDDLIRRIPKGLRGKIGIGDDAGVLSLRKKGDGVFCADAVVEGVDFIVGRIQPEAAGRKALAVNLSDMAAMGAEPLGFVVALGVPEKIRAAWLRRFYRGMMGLAGKYKIHCLGGDVSRSRQFFASVSVFGKPYSSKVICRSGASTGDMIGVTGTLGGSILKHHYAFEPRLREARFLVRSFRPHSMIDISDGLLQDLGHVLKSSEVAARLDAAAIPISREAKTLCRKNPSRALIRALTDGEDFELLFTLPASQKRKLQWVWKKKFPQTRLSWIGVIEPGRGKVRWEGKAPKLTGRCGFLHF